MSPEPPTAALRAAAIVPLLLACAACGVFKNNEEAQVVVNQRIVGMRIGDFLDRYGRTNSREPQLDGSIEFGWISETLPPSHSGYYGLDDRTCELKLIAGKDGRIVTASVKRDMPGRTSTSRCIEIFKTAV